MLPLEGGESSSLRLPVLCPEAPMPVLASREARAQGMLPGYPRSLPELPAATTLLVQPGKRYPGAEQLSRRLFTLPTHSLLQDGDLAKMCAMVRAAAAP